MRPHGVADSGNSSGDLVDKAVFHPGVSAVGESDVPVQPFHVRFVSGAAGIRAHEGQTIMHGAVGGRRSTTTGNFTRLLVGIVALLLLGTGFWAMLSPESFYAAIATYPPFNRYFVHDIGAF
jgi:hypothetical protein